MADFATRYNGTGGMWSFCGSWNPCTQLATGLVRLMLAPYTQTKGNTQVREGTGPGCMRVGVWAF